MSKKTKTAGTPNMGGVGQAAGQMMGQPSYGYQDPMQAMQRAQMARRMQQDQQPVQQAPQAPAAPQYYDWAADYGSGSPAFGRNSNMQGYDIVNSQQAVPAQQPQRSFGQGMQRNPQFQAMLDMLRGRMQQPTQAAPVAAPTARSQVKPMLSQEYKNQFKW